MEATAQLGCISLGDANNPLGITIGPEKNDTGTFSAVISQDHPSWPAMQSAFAHMLLNVNKMPLRGNNFLEAEANFRQHLEQHKIAGGNSYFWYRLEGPGQNYIFYIEDATVKIEGAITDYRNVVVIRGHGFALSPESKATEQFMSAIYEDKATQFIQWNNDSIIVWLSPSTHSEESRLDTYQRLISYFSPA